MLYLFEGPDPEPQELPEPPGPEPVDQSLELEPRETNRAPLPRGAEARAEKARGRTGHQGAAPHPTTRPELANECDYTLIFGAKGNGKTTYARRVAWARVRAGGSMVWIDATGTNGDLGHVVRSNEELRRYIGSQLRARMPVAAVVQLGWREKPGGVFETVYQLGDVLLVLDDAEDYANAQYIDPDLRELVAKGRNRRVDVLSTVRTPPELHKSLRGNPDAVVSFRQEELDYARELNRKYFRLEDGESILMNLPQFRYLHSANNRVTSGSVAIR